MVRAKFVEYMSARGKVYLAWDAIPEWEKELDRQIGETIYLELLSGSMIVEADQLRTQLAGCLVAAEGPGPVAKEGEYGWSRAYQAVLELRLKHNALEEAYGILKGQYDELNNRGPMGFS